MCRSSAFSTCSYECFKITNKFVDKFFYIMNFMKIIAGCVAEGKFDLVRPIFKGYLDFEKKIKKLV